MVTWRRAATALAASFLLLVACSSTKDAPPPTFCDVARSSASTCKDPSDCDATLAGSCTSLAKVVSAATLSAAKDCLESGVCGPAACLSQAQKNSHPGAAHQHLAADFCTFCAPNVPDCESKFYERAGHLPGLIVLPYTDDIVQAVDDACTGNDGCQAKFVKCATDTITSALAGAIDDALASCVVAGFTQDDGEGKKPGNGAELATCTPANCKGCCRDDKCLDGGATDACGAGAAACQICGGDQKCVAGKCIEPCGPNDCPGCCNGDVCVTGKANDQCGTGGAACKGCADGLVCSNGQCIDGSCQATCVNGCCSAAGCQPGTVANACGTGGEACKDCGFGRTCTSGACVIDPNALWDVYISFAEVPETNKSGSSWDALGGAPDPYLCVYTSEGSSVHSGCTTTQQDTTIPFWGETPVTGVKASELLANFSIEIWDEDVEFDDDIGGCTVPLDPATFDGSLQSYACPDTSTSSSVKFYYRINPHQ